jgi:hypothetical protein
MGARNGGTCPGIADAPVVDRGVWRGGPGARAWGRRSTRGRWRDSVGLHLTEAIRAVDGTIHAGLERHLRLVPAGRADDGEVLAGDPVVTSLVAARTTQVSHVVARIAGRPPARPAAGAAFGVGREPLLDVVLLIGGRVNELHPAVDTVQRSVDVGHETFLSSARDRRRPCPISQRGRPLRRTGRCGCVGNGRRRAIQVPLWSPCRGARVGSMAAPYPHRPKRALQSPGRLRTSRNGAMATAWRRHQAATRVVPRHATTVRSRPKSTGGRDVVGRPRPSIGSGVVGLTASADLSQSPANVRSGERGPGGASLAPDRDWGRGVGESTRTRSSA